MKRILLVLFTFVLLLSGCTTKENTNIPKAEYKKITAQEAKAAIDAGKPIILDVRTKAEYDEGHIEGATLLPDTEVKVKAGQILPDKNAKILVYCRSGNRSSKATKDLLEMGYTNVYDFGGINGWTYKIVK